MMPELHAVVAMTPSRIIGKGNDLPWHLPEDLKQFKKLTSGHAILMGRKTWDSIGRPLPKRRNLVITRQPIRIDGVEVIHKPADLLTLGIDTRIYLIGGAQIYKLMLPFCNGIYLTQLKREYEGDIYFPEFEDQFSPGEIELSNEDFEVRYWTNKNVQSLGAGE